MIAIHAYRAAVAGYGAIYFAGTEQSWITWIALPIAIVAAYDAVQAWRHAPAPTTGDTPAHGETSD